MLLHNLTPFPQEPARKQQFLLSISPKLYTRDFQERQTALDRGGKKTVYSHAQFILHSHATYYFHFLLITELLVGFGRMSHSYLCHEQHQLSLFKKSESKKPLKSLASYAFKIHMLYESFMV